MTPVGIRPFATRPNDRKTKVKVIHFWYFQLKWNDFILLATKASSLFFFLQWNVVCRPSNFVYSSSLFYEVQDTTCWLILILLRLCLKWKEVDCIMSDVYLKKKDILVECIINCGPCWQFVGKRSKICIAINKL
jgi:hypothetical protein